MCGVFIIFLGVLAAAFLFMKGEIISGILIGITLAGFGYNLMPVSLNPGAHRRKGHSSARIIGPDTILVTNLDDVDAMIMQEWHTSSLRIRERTGRNGDWIYHFQNHSDGVAYLETEMREAEASLNGFIEAKINPNKSL